VEPEVRSLLEKTANALAGEGVRVDHEARPNFSLEKVADTFMALLQSALAGGVSRATIEHYAAATEDTPVARTKRLFAMRHREWLSYNERRLQMRKKWEAFFTRWDAILLPVMPCAAILHDHSEPLAGRIAWVGGEQCPYWDLITWMAPARVATSPQFAPRSAVQLSRASSVRPNWAARAFASAAFPQRRGCRRHSR